MQIEHPKRHGRLGGAPVFEFLEGFPLGLRLLLVWQVTPKFAGFRISSILVSR